MSSEQWSSFFLLFVRFSALVSVLPFMAWRGVPVLNRIGFAAFLSFLVYSATGMEAEPLPSHFLLFALAAAGNALFGLALGFLVVLTFTAVRIAGQLVDMQSGLLMSAVLDPQHGGQETVFGQFYYSLAVVLFLSLNAHHVLLATLARSAELVPPGSLGMAPAVLPSFLALFSQMFIMAFQLAAPVMIVLILTDIALGLISKTVPQLQVFVEGMPLKVGIALLIIFFVFPYLLKALESLFYRLTEDVTLLLGLLRAPAG
jgi:flagellar biosynthetic protein FliR